MGFFKFDPHLHTAETSKCGRIPAAKLVDTYHARGYQGIAITDHLHETYISLLYCYDDWDTCVDRFMDGYRRAKARGDEIGLSVIFGIELRFLENDNDYLIYGADEQFLRAHPYLHRMGHQAFYDAFKDEVLIISAHPFRENNQVVYPDCVHGIELVNCHPDHANCNEQALLLAKQKPSLYRLCGSDTHRKGDEALGWVLFENPIHDSLDYKKAVESRRYTLGCLKESDQAIIQEAQAHFQA